MKHAFFFILLLLTAKLSAQNDCVDAIVVCGDTNFNNIAVNGPGAQQEVSSCGSQEFNSIWMKLNIATSGTLEFTIVPQNNDINEDFDFYLYSYNTCDDRFIVRCSTTNPASAGLTFNVTGTNNAETDTSEGPGADGNSFVSDVDVVAGETYMLVVDRAFGDSNFSVIWTGTATFNQSPQFDLPAGVTSIDLTECDLDGVPDQSTAFDLTQNTPLIIGSQINVAVTYYTTESDALLGVNEILTPNAFVNTSNPQTIYARIENTITECFNNSSFEITVSDEIHLEATEFSICDDATDGSLNNGQATFNMQNVTALIYPGAPAGTTINYYLSQSDANSNTSPLPQSFYNTTPNLQTVYVKITIGSCFLIAPVDLIVKTFPVVTAASLVQCDYGLNQDGITLFNLTQADAFFTNGSTGVTVAYFLDNASLAANNPLAANYTNISNPQNIIARLSYGNGCSTTYPLTLNVNVTAGQTVAGLETCDIQRNGLATFDLSQANVVLASGQTAAYYITVNDALLENNPLTSLMYANTTPYNSSVFVRIDDGTNGCSGISEIPLQVNRLPVIEPQDDAFICINQPGFQTTIDAGQLDSQPYDFVWYFNTVQLPDTTYSISVSQTGTYTVDIIDAKGCINTRTITVSPSDLPVITEVISKGTAIDNNSVTIEPAMPNYGYSIDEPDGPFQASNQFNNVSCGIHTAYVSDSNGCGVISQSFEIIGIPIYFTPNGDGYGDDWNVRCATTHPDTIVQIFDRFGKLLKQISVGGGGWDGNFNGKSLPADDYWYLIKFSDGRTERGHFALKR
ncbi:T9SS type B sorting domain-containing protein [Flavobacterium wongokense]|uniref:T9SS type B sorting domain-containing protein n=1 Tax=Flavobacterium wongokense TaxID=2910674 RepID=UPI001F3B098D|nr:T9SS type B sorting domain-containing protein [Flavobacterium sp. WG47]MCF6131614.1 T9SS type B sorting domain-containing protein [Flavobacterium sp. WG47]